MSWVKSCALCVSLIFCQAAWSGTDLSYTENQIALLTLVHRVWSEIGYPETGQAILLQETNAGMYGNGVGDRHSPVGKRSYGIMQVKVGTARGVISKFPELKQYYFGNISMANVSDEEIIVMLIVNHEFCATIAAKTFYLEMVKSNNDWSKAVAAYNVGWGGVLKMKYPEKFKYVKLVNYQLRKRVRPFNTEHYLK